MNSTSEKNIDIYVQYDMTLYIVVQEKNNRYVKQDQYRIKNVYVSMTDHTLS